MQAPYKVVYRIEEQHATATADLDVRQLRLLVELGDVMNAVIDRDVLLQTIMLRTADAMDAEGTAVIVLEDGRSAEEKPDLIFMIATGERARELSSFRLGWGEGYAGHTAETREPVVANDIGSSKRHAKRVDKKTGFDTRSLLAVPLLVRDRLVGVLEFVNKKDDGRFTPGDVVLAQAIANHVAVALERARLIGENAKALRLAAIGETIAGAAHCIKNLVNAMHGGEFVLEKGLRNQDLAKVTSGWEMLQKGVKRISELALDMLTYSKERVPQRTDVDMAAMTREVCAISRDAAATRGVRLEGPPDDATVVGNVDGPGLQRCILNLVGNAVDACAGAERPACTESRVVVRCRRDDALGIEIAVSDNGPGIPPETLARLFTPFFSTKGSKGTGLGLSVSRKIVEEHGGKMLVESKLGEGTTFTIQVPLST